MEYQKLSIEMVEAAIAWQECPEPQGSETERQLARKAVQAHGAMTRYIDSYIRRRTA